jgi:hypothetical protein
MRPDVNNFKAPADHLPLVRSARQRQQDDTLSSPEPLGHYRNLPAWVLLADPGAGKTDTFKTLCAAEGGYYTTARDFVELHLPVAPSGPLFIDGLDEMTAGHTAGQTVLGQIRAKLQQLGAVSFRLSCREADWRGNTDSKALQYLVGDNNFAELHLAPLTQEESRRLIAHWQQSNEEDAEKFMRDAEQRDLSGLLDNPQTLRLLVKAVAVKGSDWPASKTQTYDMACAQLVQEQNDAHRASQENSVLPFAHVLAAAGYLSALMLLSGRATVARQPPREAHSATVALADLHYGDTTPDKAACQAALHTRLFRSSGQGEFIPVHRTVAEYLGARYLMSRINTGLPGLRVLALMQGEDGGIVPELRGLHAWLAAMASGELRRSLIERDPLGVVLNGDVRQFNREEKLQVLQALRDEATRYTYFRNQHWISHPFGALATTDMEGDFKVLLQSPDRSQPHLALLNCVLDALAHGQHMPALAPALEQVVRDKTYWAGLRTSALRTLIAYEEGKNDKATLTQLLTDVHDNRVEDLEDELLGTLLRALYPSDLSPVEVWRYFRQPKSDHLLGNYWQFWQELTKRLTEQDEVAALLDALVSTSYQLNNEYDHLSSADLVGKLLVSGVTQQGHQIETPRLYSWLTLGLGPHHHCPLGVEHKEAIGQWLSTHEDQYKSVFEHGLGLLANVRTSGIDKVWGLRARLYEAQEPKDAQQWYLSLAHANTDENLRLQLVLNAFRVAEEKMGQDAALELLDNWSEEHNNDTAWTKDFLQWRLESEQQHRDSKKRYTASQAEKLCETSEFFGKKLPSFDPGPAHLGALVEVANAYLNFFRQSNKQTPDERLLALLNQDRDWLQLALHGLRQCLFRDDLPSAADIVNLHAESRRYHLATPCLAAMALRYADDPATALDLPPALLETVSAFRLTNNFYETPDWFKQLLKQHPAVVASVLQRLISQKISSKEGHIEGLYSLARDSSYATLAQLITRQLIANFPVKASKNQLKNLRLLMVAALTHLDRETQLTLIASKLSAKGMDVAQQAYWLTAGVLLAPELYLERTQQFVSKTQARTAHVFALIHEFRDRRSAQIDLPVSTLAFLIGLLGPTSSPGEAQSGVYTITPEIEMGDYVARLITTLEGNPDDAALEALTDLQQRQDMKHWSDSLNRALYEQRITRRKALFRPASVEQVCDTLANLKPASAADLWALTVDYLTPLALEIRNDNTNAYRQYWAGDTPKIEDDCRDALLSHLRPRLAQAGVLAEPEGRYADAKRADIKVMTDAHHIPVEIKREMHPDVWKAIGNQLIARYGRETASDGYGIFLVFWFTGQSMPAPNDGGTRPKTPKELQQRLSATVPESLRHKIAVLVVDCSKPKTT